eukprot:JP436370.1.p1 GENE.JP436370.1~~JP436370.1.p1  ORF type:complete len:158 (+),score=49.73 JP436370.1:20-493(+)
MVDQLSEDQKKEFYECFEMFDTNRDGTIEAKELGTAMRSLGQNLSPAEVQELLEEFDSDKNGSISFNEFLEIMARRMAVQDSIDLNSAFQEFDENGDGHISKDELRLMLNRLGDKLTKDERLTEDEIDGMIQDLGDVDGSGTLDYSEFKTILTASSS